LVAPVERVGSHNDHSDLAATGCYCTIESLTIENEASENHARTPGEDPQQFFSIRHLWYFARVDKARNLDSPKPGG
jgi:hypothetical protein